MKFSPQSFVDSSISHALRYGKSGKQIGILHNFRGVVKSSEMCLELGKPGSGRASLLEVIADQRSGYMNVGGEVLYGLYEAENSAKRFQGEAVCNLEADIHHLTLTVGQTLGFALDVENPWTTTVRVE